MTSLKCRLETEVSSHQYTSRSIEKSSSVDGIRSFQWKRTCDLGSLLDSSRKLHYFMQKRLSIFSTLLIQALATSSVKPTI